MWNVCEDRRGAYRVVMRTADGKTPLGYLGVGGGIKVKRISKKWEREAWTGVI